MSFVRLHNFLGEGDSPFLNCIPTISGVLLYGVRQIHDSNDGHVFDYINLMIMVKLALLLADYFMLINNL
jgi:hypothetical protein